MCIRDRHRAVPSRDRQGRSESLRVTRREPHVRNTRGCRCLGLRVPASARPVRHTLGAVKPEASCRPAEAYWFAATSPFAVQGTSAAQNTSAPVCTVAACRRAAAKGIANTSAPVVDSMAVVVVARTAEGTPAVIALFRSGTSPSCRTSIARSREKFRSPVKR